MRNTNTSPQTSTPVRLAVVEDEHSLRTDLLDFLSWRGFDAQGFACAEDFSVANAQQPFALLLLDIGLPGISGLELVQQLRALPQMPGVVMLTAFSTDEDRIAGLRLGADAYLPKGTSLQLIEATCLSVLRRLGTHTLTPLPPPRATTLEAEPPAQSAHATWVIYLTRWELGAPTGERLKLTHPEMQILRTLMQQPGTAVSRVALLSVQGKQDTVSNLRNLDNTTSRLRRKVLASCGQELPLRPSYGQGYTFAGSARLDPT